MLRDYIISVKERHSVTVRTRRSSALRKEYSKCTPVHVPVPGTCTCIILVRSCGCQIQIIYENGGESIVCRVFLQGLFLGNGSCNLRYPVHGKNETPDRAKNEMGLHGACRRARRRRGVTSDALERLRPLPGRATCSWLVPGLLQESK